MSIIGIDLGTTNSLVSVWRGGEPVLIPNVLGSYLTPSAVAVTSEGEFMTGELAREVLQLDPARGAMLFKRLMGADRQSRVGKKSLRPEELSSFVLRALKADAEDFLKEEVEEAIISVPAYFSNSQRQATKTAGRLAGLRVERLINEPTAAAIAYGLHRKFADGSFLVLDLGGGTFDVSILELFDGVMEIRASTGDNHLGGEDFVHVLEKGFLDHHQIQADKLRLLDKVRLREAAERCKLKLSSVAEAEVVLEREGATLVWTVTREVFRERTVELVRRMRGPIERAMRDCRLAPGDLDAIILAGGATRMPMISEMVVRMFGIEPECSLDPDLVVARGAAIQAGLKSRDKALDDIVMTDVCPYTLSIEVAAAMEEGGLKEGFCAPIIERNTVIPASRVEVFSPIYDNQDKVDIKVFQGEALMAVDNIQLGSLALSLSKGPKDENLFDVRFTYDINGLLEVEAASRVTGKRQRALFTLGAEVMSEGEIKRRLAALENLKIHPRDREENQVLLARGERLHAELLGPRRQLLAGVMTQFHLALESQDPKIIEKARWEFGRALDRISGGTGLEE